MNYYNSYKVMIGIIIEAKHRGQRYCGERLQDDIPAEHEATHKAFANVGFKKK
ncbi:MAG: hypothetical protein J6D39_11440 [Niameybacter sp.]|nr:hypothetical protein [Niameybacter sp.]